MSGYPPGPPNYGYGPPPPTAQPYGQTPPIAQPYGVPSAPYAPSSENPHKPSKDKPSSQNYPNPSSGYPNPSSGYPNQSSGGGYQGYQNPSSGYPNQSSGHQKPSSGYPNQSPGHPSSGYPNPSSGYPSAPPQYQPSGPGGYGSKPFGALVPSTFPPGTDPSVIACFQVADVDGSGQIDDVELQRALSSYNQSFSIRTVHLLMYLFTNSNIRKIGPREFVDVFYSLQNWRAIFDRFDRDRSGKIDPSELRDALLSLGFSVSPVVLDLLVSKFDKSGGRNKAIEYDNFIECCLTVKGLTEKFKEKDTAFTGSATFNYETFMLTVLPFLIA